MIVMNVKTKKTEKNRTRAQTSSRGRTVIRTFEGTEAEYEDVAAIENANYPDSPLTGDEFRFYDEKSGEAYLHERLVAERDERMVGFVTYGQPWWSFQPGKYFFWIAVHPDWHGTAVLKELYNAALQALGPFKPQLLTTEIREDQQYVLDLLDRQGFAATQRNPVSGLDATVFDETRFANVLQHVQDAGIRIDDLNMLAKDDPTWARKVWDLEWEILQDVPSPEPLTKAPFDEWRSRTFDSPNFVSEGYLVARDGAQYVGMSSLWKSQADPQKLGTGLTGVIRPYRRKGVATALKVRALSFAKAYGATMVETDNEENNPMLDLNKQLGFVEKPAYVMYAKELTETNTVGESTTITP